MLGEIEDSIVCNLYIFYVFIFNFRQGWAKMFNTFYNLLHKSSIWQIRVQFGWNIYSSSVVKYKYMQNFSWLFDDATFIKLRNRNVHIYIKVENTYSAIAYIDVFVQTIATYIQLNWRWSPIRVWLDKSGKPKIILAIIASSLRCLVICFCPKTIRSINFFPYDNTVLCI